MSNPNEVNKTKDEEVKFDQFIMHNCAGPCSCDTCNEFRKENRN